MGPSNKITQPPSDMKVTPEERRLLNFFRSELKYGEAHVIVKKGNPVFVKQAIMEIKLDD